MNEAGNINNQIESFVFSEEMLDAAKLEIKKYPTGRQASAVMPLLDLAQRQCNGWLPVAAMDYVASLLEMPPIKVYEVATFHVQICTTLPCWFRGSDQVVTACKKQLGIQFGETTENGEFSLSEVECLGACVNAPMMQINDDYYEDLDSVSTESILTQLSLGETPKNGSQIERKSCEPIGGLTTLTDSSIFVSGDS